MATSETATIVRNIGIRSNVVKRLRKELDFYKKELEGLEQKRDDLLKSGTAEGWDERNAEKLVDESKRMTQDTANRLKNALDDLSELLATAKKMPSTAELEVAIGEVESSGLLADA